MRNNYTNLDNPAHVWGVFQKWYSYIKKLMSIDIQMYQTFRPDGDVFLALLQKKKCRKPALNAGLRHFFFSSNLLKRDILVKKFVRITRKRTLVKR